MENSSIFQELGNKRIEQLDGLRGICALIVLSNHLIYGSYWVTQNPELYPTLFFRSIASFGHIAVLLFFVLSGFVIGYTTPKKFTWKEAKNYIIRRLIRLYPIYVVAIFLTFALAETPSSIIDIVGHLFFMQGWLVPVVKNNLPLWSLHYEFIFYLLFLVVWKFNIKISHLIYFCVLSGILSAIFIFHPLEILGYFTLWLGGFWLAKNLANFSLISENFVSYRFWTPCILIAAFSSQNIFKMTIDKYGASSLVLPDLLLGVLVTSVVASLIVKDKISWYNLFFKIILSIVIITIGYSWIEHTFLSFNGLMFGYQSTAFFLFLLPITLFLKIVPVGFFKKIAKLGSFSYALYVIHHPVLIIFYRLLVLNNFNIYFISIIANILITFMALLLAWVLECYLQPKIAKKLKTHFNLL